MPLFPMVVVVVDVLHPVVSGLASGYTSKATYLPT